MAKSIVWLGIIALGYALLVGVGIIGAGFKWVLGGAPTDTLTCMRNNKLLPGACGMRQKDMAYEAASASEMIRG
ncbi:MAG: hypothetical protein P8L31_05845 [Pseudomonadales bacterium]|nr:hypothetical protein [Pseudomonadales bacterium]